jgi:hypothetical protein
LSISRGLATIVACCVGLGAAGGTLGLTLGAGAPAYYRGVFRAADDPGFNPVHVGLGLGITQGLVCGVVVGCVLVLTTTLSQCPRREGEPIAKAMRPADIGRPRPTWMRRLLILAAFLFAIACGGAVGYVLGALGGQWQLYQHSTDTKLAKIRPILQDQRFAGVNAESSSAAQVYLIGTVGSQQAYNDLEEGLRFLFGDEEMRFMMDNVKITKE